MMDRVRGDLGLRDSSLLTDTDLTNWLNEAQDFIATETLWYRTSQALGTTISQKEYALPLPTTGRCIKIEEISYDTFQLVPITLEKLLRYDPYYRTNGNSRPQWYYLRGNSGFGLHPTPNVTDVDILNVVYVGKPPRVTGTQDFFYVPHGMERGLIIYGKMLASEKDAHGEGARRVQKYEGQWVQFLQEVKRQVSNVAERVAAVMGEDGAEAELDYRRMPLIGANISP